VSRSASGSIGGDCQSGIGKFVRIRDIGNESDKGIPAELREVDQRLRKDRPALSALELDEIKVRALDSAPRSATMRLGKKKGKRMKSRLAVVMVLALGLFMCGTGASLAASGSSGSGSAGSAQYPEENEKNKLCVEGEEAGSGSGSGNAGCKYTCEEIAAGAEASPEEEAACTEPAQETSSGGGGSLPYTGFPTIPVMLIGLGLLGAGAAVRLKIRAGEQF
jgi:hypothetical protein